MRPKCLLTGLSLWGLLLIATTSMGCEATTSRTAFLFGGGAGGATHRSSSRELHDPTRPTTASVGPPRYAPLLLAQDTGPAPGVSTPSSAAARARSGSGSAPRRPRAAGAGEVSTTSTTGFARAARRFLATREKLKPPRGLDFSGNVGSSDEENHEQEPHPNANAGAFLHAEQTENCVFCLSALDGPAGGDEEDARSSEQERAVRNDCSPVWSLAREQLTENDITQLTCVVTKRKGIRPRPAAHLPQRNDAASVGSTSLTRPQSVSVCVFLKDFMKEALHGIRGYGGDHDYRVREESERNALARDRKIKIAESSGKINFDMGVFCANTSTAAVGNSNSNEPAHDLLEGPHDLLSRQRLGATTATSSGGRASGAAADEESADLEPAALLADESADRSDPSCCSSCPMIGRCDHFCGSGCGSASASSASGYGSASSSAASTRRGGTASGCASPAPGKSAPTRPSSSPRSRRSLSLGDARIRALPACRHLFHADCLFRALQLQAEQRLRLPADATALPPVPESVRYNCPVCRTPSAIFFREEEEEDLFREEPLHDYQREQLQSDGDEDDDSSLYEDLPCCCLRACAPLSSLLVIFPDDRYCRQTVCPTLDKTLVCLTCCLITELCQKTHAVRSEHVRRLSVTQYAIHLLSGGSPTCACACCVGGVMVGLPPIYDSCGETAASCFLGSCCAYLGTACCAAGMCEPS